MKFYLDKQQKFDIKAEVPLSYRKINCQDIIDNNLFHKLHTVNFMVVYGDNKVLYSCLIDKVIELDYMNKERSIDQVRMFLPINDGITQRDYCEVSEEFIFLYLDFLNNGGNYKESDKIGKFTKLINALKRISKRDRERENL